MNIIDQLEQTVTLALLGDPEYSNDSQGRTDNVAYISLLEQFYAILASRLALPQIYSQLMRSDQTIITDTVPQTPLFEQLWQDPRVQKTIIQELSADHHIDEVTTAELLINAAPLAYRELKIMANGQFLPAFLQAEHTALRPYLPIWSAPVITATQGLSDISDDAIASPMASMETDVRSDISLNKAQDAEAVSDAIVASTIVTSSTSTAADIDDNTIDNNMIDGPSAIHANPAEHHLAENASLKREEVRTRNQRNDLLVRVFLLLGAVAAIGFAAWALFLKPSNDVPVEPVVAAPMAVTPAPVEQALTPVELIVGVDDSGNLYTCSATVGDEILRSALQNALNTSFGEQSSICTLAVQTDTAAAINNIPLEKLTDVLTMLRSTPFARLHLQNDRLTLEAPDSILLQRLVTDMRSLAPALVIDSTAPLPLPEGNGANMMNETNNQFENGGSTTNNQGGNDYSNGTGEYQAADDDTGDSEIPAPPPPNNYSNAPANIPSNAPRNVPSNTQNNINTRPPGPFSPSEVDEMANTVIVAEPAQVR